jgi:acetate kinase
LDLVGGVVTAGPHLHVLVLNCGSSSLKFGLFETGPARLATLVSGEAAAIGQPRGAFSARDASGREISENTALMDYKHVIDRVLQLFADWRLPPPLAVGHRIVHGGPKLREHCLIDGAVMTILTAAAPFAPLHIPEALKVIDAAKDLFPGARQAACFDTTFHAAMPDVARILPIPRTLEAEGVYRYGFHGLSCESILHQLGETPPDRLVIAHLGNGASVTALKAGKSIDNSMGLTPTGGVMMGARSGDLDPGVLLYLMREKHLNAERLEELVDRQSGLRGVSGLSSDMRDLHAAASNPAARLAIDMFAYQVRKHIAAMISVLGGVDCLVFTGGIGENDPSFRTAICAGLACMGVDLHPVRNAETRNPIHAPASRCSIQVLPSQEDEQIARHTRALILPGEPNP